MAPLNPQLRPLEVDPSTNEPFLRLRPHPKIILTPPRLEDAPRLTALLSNPIIYEQLARSPVPYLLEHAEAYLAKAKPQSDALLKELDDARDQEELITVSGCPVSFLREIQEDGTQLLIGHVEIASASIVREEFEGGQRNKIVGENKGQQQPAKEREDEDQPVPGEAVEWTIGDWLSPSHHGKSIMTDAIGTLIHEWAVPRMKAQCIVVGAFPENLASVRVFEKNGFKTRSVRKDAVEVRGERRGLHIMDWGVSGA